MQIEKKFVQKNCFFSVLLTRYETIMPGTNGCEGSSYNFQTILNLKYSFQIWKETHCVQKHITTRHCQTR